jgi:hypothetical protein
VERHRDSPRLINHEMVQRHVYIIPPGIPLGLDTIPRFQERTTAGVTLVVELVQRYTEICRPRKNQVKIHMLVGSHVEACCRSQLCMVVLIRIRGKQSHIAMAVLSRQAGTGPMPEAEVVAVCVDERINDQRRDGLRMIWEASIAVCSSSCEIDWYRGWWKKLDCRGQDEWAQCCEET